MNEALERRFALMGARLSVADTAWHGSPRIDVRADRRGGHDEEDWFVAAVPEDAPGVTGLSTAKLALQPAAVRDALPTEQPKDPFRRRNAAYVRQGEWFFLPAPHLRVPDAVVPRDEPLTRGRGNAHRMQYGRQDGVRRPPPPERASARRASLVSARREQRSGTSCSSTDA